MRKLCLGALLLCALLLCACQGAGNQEDQQAASYQEAMAKAQAIQIQDAAGQTVDTLSQTEEIAKPSWRSWTWATGPIKRPPPRHSPWGPLCSSRSPPSSWARLNPTAGSRPAA